MKVFDASAVLAVPFNEAGADQAVRWLEDDNAMISSVAQAEVLAKLLDQGLSEAGVTAITQQLPLQVVPFSAAQGVTADRPWAALAGFDVAMIR